MTEINKEQLAVWANGYRCDSDIAIKTMAKMLFDFMDRAEKEPVTWTEMPFSFEELEQMHGATFANGYIRGWARKCESVTMKGSLYTTPQLNSPEIPDGWKLVPIEPTQNMVDAHISGMQLAGFSRAYRDMLATAPEPQNQQQNIPENIPQGWINCSDHRPERGTDVQVYCSDTREQFVAFHIGNGEFQYAQHEDTSIACRPSHWMPLLAAPEKENG